jgi:ubiquinone/menaquinone biosynthesis C-methylase UbiE
MESIKIIRKSEYEKKFKKPEQEGVWDNIAITWSEYRNKTIPIIEDFLKKASSDFEKSKNNKEIKIIDLGCGSGRNMIASKNFEYYEVDISSNQLALSMQRAEELGVNAKFFKMSADKLSKKDFKNEMFDYGLFIATLHCIEGEKERKNALKEFYRVLKKNAEGIITIWDSEDSRFKDVENHGDIYMSWKVDGKEHMRYYYLFSKDEFIDLLEGVGFKIIKFYEKEDKDRFSKKNWIVRVKKI